MSTHVHVRFIKFQAHDFVINFFWYKHMYVFAPVEKQVLWVQLQVFVPVKLTALFRRCPSGSLPTMLVVLKSTENSIKPF